MNIVRFLSLPCISLGMMQRFCNPLMRSRGWTAIQFRGTATVLARCDAIQGVETIFARHYREGSRGRGIVVTHSLKYILYTVGTQYRWSVGPHGGNKSFKDSATRFLAKVFWPFSMTDTEDLTDT